MINLKILRYSLIIGLFGIIKSLCEVDALDISYNGCSEETFNIINETSIYSTLYENSLLKVALCAIGKNENLYVREWVEYYKNIGIKKIFLYDNNELNGEKFEEVINDYIENGFVEILDRRGIVLSINNIKNDYKSIQGQSYLDCYYNNYKDYDWIFFFDIDEFISIVHTYKNIFEFLNDFKEYDGIKIPSKMYGDNGKLYYENKPVIERFKNENNMGYENEIKTILKCKEYNYDLLFNAHGVLNKEVVVVNLKRMRLSPDKNRYSDTTSSKPYEDLPVYLDHFYSKSTEEYIKRKYKKTSASRGVTKGWNYSLETVKKRYFKFNKITKKKIRMFNKYYRKLSKERKKH